MNLLNMNYNKLFSKILMASGLIILVGVVLQIVLGLNTVIIEPVALSALIFDLALAELIINLAMFIYLRLRFDWSTALTVVIVNVFNCVLTCSMLAITRLQVSQALFGSIVIASILGNISNLLVFSRARQLTEKETDWNEIVNKSIFENARFIVLIHAVMILLLVCIAGTQISTTMSFVVTSIVALAVSLFSSLFVACPLWAVFRKREVKLTRQKNKADHVKDEIVENKQEVETIEEENIEIK